MGNKKSLPDDIFVQLVEQINVNDTSVVEDTLLKLMLQRTNMTRKAQKKLWTLIQIYISKRKSEKSPAYIRKSSFAEEKINA